MSYDRLMAGMFDLGMHSPAQFVEVLRAFRDAEEAQRGALANRMSEAIITKRVDLAEVRQLLLDAGDAELMDVLDRFIDLIEPYIEEGGVEE